MRGFDNYYYFNGYHILGQYTAGRNRKILNRSINVVYCTVSVTDLGSLKGITLALHVVGSGFKSQ